MNIFKTIKEALIEILDIEDRDIHPESYLIRELGVESIDLLELAVALNSRLDIEIDDDEIFLKEVRAYVEESALSGKTTEEYLIGKLPFLTRDRAKEIIDDLKQGPALKVKDLISYLGWKLGEV